MLQVEGYIHADNEDTVHSAHSPRASFFLNTLLQHEQAPLVLYSSASKPVVVKTGHIILILSHEEAPGFRSATAVPPTS